MQLMSEQDTSRWMTATEVAAQLRVSADTIMRLLRKGELEGVKVGGQWRVKPSSLEAYLRRPRKKQSE